MVWGYLLCASFSLGVAQATTQSHSLGHLEPFTQRARNARPPGGTLLPRTGPAAGVPPLRLRRRSGRRRGSRRRLCDFGFDLPGDELIPLYNRLRGDRKMAARYLRRHGDHRARAGRGPGKIQPLWRRVSLTTGSSGGRLGSVAPAARPWRRGLRTRTPGHSQTPQTATRRVSLSSTPRTRRTEVSSSQPVSSPESAQHRLKQGQKMALRFARLSAHLVALDTHCPTDACRFQKPVPLAQTPATAPTAQLRKHTLWSAACACYIHEWLQTPLFRTPKQHPPGPGTCRPLQ